MVKTLVELCSNVGIKNVREIHDLGTLPYHLARPILLRIDSAAHLRELEERSPHFAGDDAECWLRLIKKEFPTLHAKHNYEPKNPTRWFRIYEKYRDEDLARKREAEQALRSAFAGIKKESEQNRASVVNFNRSLPRPPREGRAFPVGPKGTRPRIQDHSSLRFTGGTKTKTTTAQGVLKRARREAKEITRRNKLNTPTGALIAARGQITEAPQAMKDEYRKKAQPVAQSLIRAPSSKRTVTEVDRRLKEREDRLRALKTGGTKQGVTMVSDSEDGDDYDQDDEDDRYGGGIFDDDDDEPPSPPPKPKPAPSKKSSGHILSNRPSGQPRYTVSAATIASSARTQHPSGLYENRSSPAKAAPPPPPAQHSPPPRTMSANRATSPDMASRKRKGVDIFMNKKKSRQR